ncbi:hypothetical protein D4R86_04220 [bacterium]|nr:MAG: hypothetical protein D4R86_04220 [bacterium]
MEGWIKLYRKFSEWEWFNISEMVHLFIYLLLNANHEDGEWRGIEIKRGQILTGLYKLNDKTKISIQTLRTCLKRLEKTNEINIQTTNKYSIITICNYESYQGIQQTTNKQPNKQLTSNQQATNKQLTTNNNNKELNNEKKKKNKYAEYVSMLLEEYEKLIKEHGQKNTDILISILNNYKGSNGKKYKSDYLAILNWVIDRAKKDGKYEGKPMMI